MRLPNGENAEVDIRKLTEYCLSDVHPVGKHKAVVFEAVLGITVADAFHLRQWLLKAAMDGDATAVRSDQFGERFQIDFEIFTQTGRGIVRSAWIIRSDEDFPRLTTCFVLPR